ncbi:hypothetical protein AB0904_27660 [Streptomyces sp. NPDC006684]|uniref:hypothetical protein n=1 Tax=Streptomyces sp. NPDC006684 TaxID=3154477 RepID=UPI0034527FD0
MFPNDPLDVRVELRTGTAWTDITKDVYTRDAITHTRGLRNAGTSADPASVPLTINNKGGKYSPRNAMSPYYGLIGRNTPVRLTVPGAPVHLAVDGTPDTRLSTPYTADLTTDALDVRVDVEPYGWDATTTQQHLISMWDETDPALRAWEVYLYSGFLYLVWTTTDGTVWNYGWAPPAELPRRAVLRITYDTTDTGLSRVRTYWSTSMDGGPWTRFGRDVLLSRPTPIRAAAVPLTIARRGLTGAVYRAQVRSSEDGPILADLDLTAAQPGATSLTDETGRTWTASTATAVTDRWPRFVGEVSEWPQRWTPGEHDVWTSVEAAGVLRRYGQGVKALDSPLRRRIPSGSPVAYWPMEDGREATQAYSPIARVQPLILAGAAMASDDTLAGSLPVPTFSGAASFGQQVPRGPDGDWMVSYVYRMDTPPPGKFRALDVQTTGVARRLVLEVASDRYWFTGYGAQGQQLFQLYYTIRNADFFQTWNRLEITARLRGAQTEYHHGWIPVENAVGTGNEAYITGAPGHVTSVAMSGNVGDTGGISLGHLAVLPSADTSLYDRADSAYAGESVRTRMTRLALEEGVPLSFERGFGTPQMGGQTADTLLTLLQSGAETDGGRLTEDPARIGLRYRERATLYTQEPALVLDYQAPGLAPPLEPTDDDQDTRNDITVQRSGGSSARAVLEAGPLSVQDPPAGIGRYDESVTLSLYRDDQPADHAAWRLHLGAWDGARYPAVKVLLHKAPHLIPSVLQLREGDLIRIVNLPGWISREPVDLIVEGWTETLLPRRWEITLVCSPGGPWMTAVTDHPTFGTAGTDGSELASALTATATTVRVRTTDGPSWTTDPAEMPVDIAIDGETMRVTAIGAPVSGVQTFTVTRSLNGVVKTHAAGASVALAHPAIASL